jgi:hypothetical protein
LKVTADSVSRTELRMSLPTPLVVYIDVRFDRPPFPPPLFFRFQLEEVDDLENDIDEVLQSFEEQNKEPVLHSVGFY